MRVLLWFNGKDEIRGNISSTFLDFLVEDIG